MDLTPFIGISLYVLGGLAGACFYLPFGRVKNWAWESYWLVYAVVGLIVVPWVLAAAVSPNVLSVLRQASWQTLGWCYLFGAMWGVGGLTWGLMIRYLGVGLGLAVGCGVCASVGTLIPPVFEGNFPTLLATDWGIATLAGIGVAVLGIAATGVAGMSKERELSEEQKKAAVAEFNFPKGILLGLFSGVMSAGMAFGLHAGGAIEKAALHVQPYTREMWKGIPVLVVVLLGGFTVNFLWCLYLNAKNRTGGDYLKAGAPLLANIIFAGLAGAIWYSQLAVYKVADAQSGAGLSFAGWTVFMSSMIIFSTLLGLLLGEWKGVSGRTKGLLAASLLILVGSLVTIGYGNYLKPAVTEGQIVKIEGATLVVRDKTDDLEKTIQLGAAPVVLRGGRPASLADLKAQQSVIITQLRHGPAQIELPVEAKQP